MTLHDDRWRDHAACRGLDGRAWFPERGQPLIQGIDPYEVCAGCPVLLDCLHWAIETGERHGIHGGAGDTTKRLLRRAWPARTHNGYRGRHDGAGGRCTCPWCSQVTAHIDRLRHATERIQSNGPDARHGYRSTYARGCRCARCKFAPTVIAQQLRAAGVDVPAWWDRRFGGRHGYSTHPRTVARQVAVAKHAGAEWLEQRGHAA